MNKIETVLNKQQLPSYITPLFWQHGENEAVLREEILQMHENGIGSFIVESRPYPDFLGEKWWQDLDVIIDEAKKRDMKVWIFDDSAYPSGYSAGRIKDSHPEYLKLYLRENHVDVIGPLRDRSFMIKAWLEEGENLVKVVAARRLDGADKFESGLLTDLTDRVADGVLYWDIPEGSWRIFVLVCTRHGGEDWTKDYINPLEAEAVKAFIETVHQEHYKHYADEFGKTIAGFFTDEPRFGNASTYEGTIGRYTMVLPYSNKLLDQLSDEWKADFSIYLPCLWYDGGEITAEVRYTYMNVVSRLFGENFTMQIGNWCREHNVRLIGHVVEDNGAHARLGYGAGNFFRSIGGQDCSGLDIVYQVWPEYTSGRFTTPFGYLQADFFYWGITKMASSAGHIDPGKKGTTVCEVFGAYGWQEGLKLMKWLTDHICVRGVNFIIPHAFSPRYPDPDCPPHFYARGHNPQWRYFSIWSAYANRVCHLLSDGTHMAPVAVLYHAEAEWGGEAHPFEKAVKVLLQRQIDCDVLPIDVFSDAAVTSISKGAMTVNDERYGAIIIPYSQYLPSTFIERLLQLAENNVYVIFIEGFPERSYFDDGRYPRLLDKLKASSFCGVCSYEELAARVDRLGLADIKLADAADWLRYYHYKNEGRDIYFFTNESLTKDVDTIIAFRGESSFLLYEAMDDRTCRVDCRREKGCTQVRLKLRPYESVFLLSCTEDEATSHERAVRYEEAEASVATLEGSWKVSLATAEEYPVFKAYTGSTSLGNISKPGLLPEFSGTICYETIFEVADTAAGSGRIFIDLGEVYEIAEVFVNGRKAGARICPPYVLELTEHVNKGMNILQVHVTNTLAKQFGQNWMDRSMPQEPSGLLGPVRLLYK